MARTFNGTSDYLEYGSPVVSAVPLSMACWFFHSGAVLNQATTLMNIGDSGADSRVTLFSNNLSLFVNTIAVGGGFGTASAGPVKIRAWQHAVGVWASSSDRRVFIDGARKATDGSTAVLGTPTVTTIGARYSAGVRGAFWGGLVADAAIWNIALDDADAWLLGRGYSPQLVRPGNLVAYWPLLGRHSPAELDIKGRFDQTVNGAKPSPGYQPSQLLPLTRHRKAIDLLGSVGVSRKRFFLIPS